MPPATASAPLPPPASTSTSPAHPPRTPALSAFSYGSSMAPVGRASLPPPAPGPRPPRQLTRYSRQRPRFLGWALDTARHRQHPVHVHLGQAPRQDASAHRFREWVLDVRPPPPAPGPRPPQPEHAPRSPAHPLPEGPRFPRHRQRPVHVHLRQFTHHALQRTRFTDGSSMPPATANAQSASTSARTPARSPAPTLSQMGPRSSRHRQRPVHVHLSQSTRHGRQRYRSPSGPRCRPPQPAPGPHPPRPAHAPRTPHAFPDGSSMPPATTSARSTSTSARARTTLFSVHAFSIGSSIPPATASARSTSTSASARTTLSSAPALQDGSSMPPATASARSTSTFASSPTTLASALAFRMGPRCRPPTPAHDPRPARLGHPPVDAIALQIGRRCRPPPLATIHVRPSAQAALLSPLASNPC